MSGVTGFRAGLIDELVERCRGLLAASDRPRTLIGVAGAPGAGKTTLAVALAAALGGFPFAAHVPMDGYHLADVELARLGLTDRKGAAETFDPGGYAVLLERIGAGEQVWAPGFERVLEQPIAQAVPVVAQTRVVVSEGNYLLLPDPRWRRVRAAFDEVWCVRTADSERVRRLIARHVEFGKSPEAARAWVLRTDEANAAVVSPSAHDADLLIDV